MPLTPRLINVVGVHEDASAEAREATTTPRMQHQHQHPQSNSGRVQFQPYATFAFRLLLPLIFLSSLATALLTSPPTEGVRSGGGGSGGGSNSTCTLLHLEHLLSVHGSKV